MHYLLKCLRKGIAEPSPSDASSCPTVRVRLARKRAGRPPPAVQPRHPVAPRTTPPLNPPPRRSTLRPVTPPTPRRPHVVRSLPISAISAIHSITPLYLLPTDSLPLSRTTLRHQQEVDAGAQIKRPTTSRPLTLSQRTTSPPAKVSPTAPTRSPHPITTPGKRRRRGIKIASSLARVGAATPSTFI